MKAEREPFSLSHPKDTAHAVRELVECRREEREKKERKIEMR